jgi:hypothetical protein
VTEDERRLRAENDMLRSLAVEFRVPVPNELGGYGEVVVQRWTIKQDRWLIADGANTNSKIWIGGNWRPYLDYGIAEAHCYTLDEALAEARQVAEYEAAAFDAQVRAIQAIEEEQP